MKFKEMSKYKAGRSEEGHDQFNIPLQPDEDGFFGRECPNEDCDTKYFKINKIIPDGMEAIAENFSQADLTCPYCGTRANMQRFYTQTQLEWIKSMMVRDIHRAFGDMLERSVSPYSKPSGGMFSVSFKVKRGTLPSVRYYVEEKLRQELNHYALKVHRLHLD